MPYVCIDNVRIAGIASCVPRNAVSNLDCPPERLAERQRLVRNIGIEHRRLADADVCLSDLTQHAAERLLSDLGWSRDEVDAVIVVTQSPDHPYPGNAILLQDRLGLPQSCLAFDINLGCSGYPYGLFVLASMMSAGKLKKALLLVGDKSTNPNSEDQGFVVLFSDAGTATALVYDDAAPRMHFDLNSDGSGYRAIYCPAGGNRVPIQPEHLVPKADDAGVVRRAVDIVLDGPAILNFSITRIPPAVESLLRQAGVAAEQVDYFFLHQANRMINETIRKKLRLPPERVPSTLREFGNTSSASIPITMTVAAGGALAAGGQRVVMSGFGVGLSWASCLVDFGPTVMSPLVEV
ncbi:ketoacyl-ACP synthase III [Pseudorhodoferax soli]|uniref:3-oxoacyl-[acyl-carrier-protein] synthase-3 n=1 Tax=Pseudorhodoferax soli TaxID=545864 RepID=A0A368XIG1_9BURK|nr:ketoacyl-ACP synthase III [Pseudorhodoferax soli]RCW67605.1 3-oxoacyl-[acyl-carrier-protein] synthase-3 [Pseudorhodoferax soli]